MQYRPEIDGLRALAVMPVVLFHAGVPWASGGYVGVDIFFVISGYLITTILLGDIAADRFSILHFYERRVRRILPALFVMAAVTSVVAIAVMFPADLREYGKALLGVGLFVSNIIFWRDTGYFDNSAELRPLLHTWSLSIEEQYYLVIPLLLVLIAPLGRRAGAAILSMLLLASLAACAVLIAPFPDMTFYSLHTRAWELLAGSLVAIALLRGARPVADWGAWLGIALIFGAILVFDETTPFPSLWALVPVLGAVLVIVCAAPGGSATRVLSSRPMIGIGLISYSVYLWHWPLLSFTRYLTAGPPQPFLLLATGALSLPVGYLSWRFVEQPFRRGGWAAGVKRKPLFGLAAVGMAVLTGLAVLVYRTEGLPNRSTPAGPSYAALAITERLAPNIGMPGKCGRGFTLAEDCATGPEPSVLAWGDSYLMHLVPAVVAQLPPGRELRQMTLPSCGPVQGYTLVAGKAATEACQAFNDGVMTWLASGESGIRTVVMSSTFVWMVLPKYRVVDDRGLRFSASPGAGAARLRAHLEKLRALDIEVILISPPPRSGWNLGRCTALALIRGRDASTCDYDPAQEAGAHAIEVADLLRSVEDVASVIWLGPIMCKGHRCPASAGPVMIYRDTGHLSLEGSLWLGRQPAFAAALGKAFGRGNGARGDD